MFHFIQNTYQKMMNTYSPSFTRARFETGIQWHTWTTPNISGNLKLASFLLVLIVFTNVGSYFYGTYHGTNANPRPDLYLLDRAGMYVTDLPAFEKKVKSVSQRLNIPPEWLMSVMYSESKFNAEVENLRGSGAIGLIQFMPATAKDMGTSVNYIKKLGPVEQLEYVYQYLDIFRRKYGEYKSLTDLYLAILYPKARPEEMCYSLYAQPSKAYKQNSGLDIDKDGRVTVSDIDKRMKRLFGPAYIIEKAEMAGL
ncbi:MAG: transglycosylase SLT domain-containing protein [Bacteroidia bacterium]